LDLDLILKSVSKTKKLITIEEGALKGGFGAYVLEEIIDKIPKETRVKMLGLPDKFIEHGDRDILLDRYGLSPQKIKQTVTLHFNNVKV